MKRIYQLSWREYGDRTLPTLVLLEGLGMASMAWPENLIRTLVCQGLHVLAPDNRDCGASERCDVPVSRSRVFWSILKYCLGFNVTAPYSIADMAADVEELLDTLEIERVHMVGFSLGGMIAQEFAIHAPHRTLSLTCLSSASGNPRTGMGRFRILGSLLRGIGASHEMDEQHQRILAFMRQIGTPGIKYDEAAKARALQVVKDARVTEESICRQILAILAGGNRCPKLRQLLVPTLVIHGKLDSLLPFRAGKELATCIEGARLMPLDGMGHDLPEKYVTQIGQAIAAHCYSVVSR